MSVNLIVFIIFCIALVTIALFYRNSTLDKLNMLPDENILFQETGKRVEQSGSPRTVIFINCIVKVTDKRIIIAQKMLFSKKYALRHVIFYDQMSGSTDLKASFKKGYLTFNILKNGVHVSESSGEYDIRINIPESALTRGQYIKYKTSRDDYRKLFRINSTP
jgi:hypothetical protein